MSASILDTIRTRRTVRRFTKESVSDDEVDGLIEAAMYAPSRLNRRPWHFLIVRNSRTRRRMAEELRVHPYLEQAPVVILVCGTPDSSPTWLMDVSAATENVLLAAAAQGLGAAWVGAPGTTVWDRFEESLHADLGIPETVRVAALVAVGRPAEILPPHDRADRYEVTKIHRERWGLVARTDPLERPRT